MTQVQRSFNFSKSSVHLMETCLQPFLVRFLTVTLQMLYKLKTSKAFEKPKPVEGRAADLMEEDPFAVQMVSWCPQSRILCVVGISAHIILYRFSKYDANTQITVRGGRIRVKEMMRNEATATNSSLKVS